MKKEEIRTIILHWQRGLLPEVSSRLSNLFDSADDVLMEYADKAESNDVQSMFLDGQRELWRKKERFKTHFSESFAKELFVFLIPGPRADAPGAEVLSLVSKDAFEQSLALKTISEQAISNNQELYYALSQRLGVVSGSPAIPYTELPAGPHQLAKAFEGSASMLSIERRVLLTLYTLFEREVIRESPPWHHELNEALRKKGILPHLRYEIKLDPNRSAGRTELSPKDTTITSLSAAPFPAVPRNHKQAAKARAVSDNRTADHSSSFGGYPSASVNVPPVSEGRGVQVPRAQMGFPRFASDPGIETRPAGATSSVEQEPLSSSGLGDPLYPSAGEGTQGLGDELLGRIRDLLVAQRARKLAAGTDTVRPDPVNPAGPDIVAASIDSRQVQQEFAPPETPVLQDGVKRVLVPRELLEKLRVALASQRTKIKESVGEDRLSHFDEDTIDIVGMLFEIMLNDERLSNTVKALLSHLHTPYLKIAVRNKEFLANKEYPARLLLDNMIEAGTRWVNEQDLTTGIYPRLQRIVDLVMKAGDSPLLLLQELNEGLAADIKLRSQRQSVREIRTVEAEKGKARLEDARRFVTDINRQFLRSSGTPAPFQTFIQGAWADYMTLLYLRTNGNTDSNVWQGALDLCNRLAECVYTVSSGQCASESELDAIRKELSGRLEEAIPHYKAKVEQLFEIFATHREIEIVAPQPSVRREPQIKVHLSMTGSVLTERLPNLPSGSWVVFHEQDGDRVVKLSWFNHKTKRFLFVDQAGAKALVVPLELLADRIDRERAHVLLSTGASYVESSLERALNALEKRKSG